MRPPGRTTPSAAVSTRTASQRRRRLIYCVVSPPLLVALGALTIALTGLILRWLPLTDGGGWPTPSRGNASHDQELAAALARGYCSRLTGTPCHMDAADSTLIPHRLPRRARPVKEVKEWKVDGSVRESAGVSRCSVRFDADTRELRVFTRESVFTSGESAHAVPAASAANGDIGAMSLKEEEQYARLYLARAGIDLPRIVRPVRVTGGVYPFGYDVAVGDACLVRVRIDPTDGRLLSLVKLTLQRSKGQPPVGRP